MATLFAARDAAGVTRFIGDVGRGAACGCFCPVCSAPLVAKQGLELDWHFAHEAGTERPECRAGAMNLLRRLAVEELSRRGPILLPTYSVAHPLGGREPIETKAHPAGELQLLEVRSSQTPVAILPLREGGTAQVFVCIDREGPPAASVGSDQAVLVVWCPCPGDGEIRTEAQAREFVWANLRLHWASLPDFDGRRAAAQAEARAFMEKLQRERALQAGARWGAVRRAMQAPAPPRSDPPPLPPAPQARISAAPGSAPSWAPGLVVGTSIHYRAMDDGSQWVCYQHAPYQWRLCPVPHAQDGWDESFPASMAVPEGDAWLRVVDFGKLLMLFNVHATASRIDSDPRVIEELFQS